VHSRDAAGRAAGSLIAVVLIASYYLLLIMGAGMARQAPCRRPLACGSPMPCWPWQAWRCCRAWNNFAGRADGSRALGASKTWMRLIRVRTVRVRAAAARITNGSRTQRDPGHFSGRKLAIADGFCTCCANSSLISATLMLVFVLSI